MGKQVKILDEFDEILENENQDKEGILTLDKSQTYKQLLHNEVTKLKNFDVVLAVVGTMKAGKSTTINAIVGREILPNRNRPMTALPTLICHSPTHTIPKLSINPTVLNTFLDDIRPFVSDVQIYEGMHEDMINLINFVKDGKKFNSSYDGEASIFEFLYQLNDLVRLAKEIENEQLANGKQTVSKFPFDNYKNFENLPKIEVAFKLEEDFDTQGRFMLLDTAGPNEAGQDELKVALKEQLARSSAVMIVLDYTQLNSDAEKDVKEQIDKIPSIQKSRLFALVNKFDQKNANSDSADSVRQHIFNKLLKDKIELDNIYAVSAQDAYLASRLLTCLTQIGKPAYQDQSWVADFAQKMYGRRPQENYESAGIEELHSDIKELQDDSRMNEPMQNVIINMQKNAPLIAMQSALAESKQVFGDLHNTLDIRGIFAQKEALSQSQIDKLQAKIDELTHKKAELDQQSAKFKQDLQQIAININQNVGTYQKIEQIEKDLESQLTDLFKGENVKLENKTKDLEGKHSATLKNFLKFQTEDERAEGIKDLAITKLKRDDNTDGILKFSTKEEFQEFEWQINEATTQLMNNTATELKILLARTIDETKTQVEKLTSQGEQLLQSIQTSFEDTNINLRIDTDYLKPVDLDTHMDNVELRAIEQNKIVTVRQGGMAGTAKRLLGKLFDKKDWGIDKLEVTFYTMDLDLVHSKTFNVLRQQVREWSIIIKEQTDSILDESTQNMEHLSTQIEQIVNEVINGIERDKQLSQESKEVQEAYKAKIGRINTENNEILEDWDSINKAFGGE